MKVAVINETSAADRNKDILAALQGRGLDVINVGMTQNGAKPELQYIHTGFMAALLLNLHRVDLVVGGCGTGQGFLNSVMQYPNIFCGHILNSLDAYLFAQINDGNCISLALNQGYGWAAEINLKLIFDTYFSVERGAGFPAHRREPQAASRQMLKTISSCTHQGFDRILETLPDEVTRPALTYPGMAQLVDVDTIADPKLKVILQKHLA